MSELNIIPQPEANVPPSLKNVVQQNVEEQQEEANITLDDLLTRKTVLLGDQEISPNLVQKANAGDIDSIASLESSLRKFNKSISKVKIASDDPRRYENLKNLTPLQKGELKKYKDGRAVVLDLLKQTNPRTNKPRVQDERVQQLLVDYFSTGQFFTETSRRLAEAGRGVTLTPVLINMLYHVVGAATDAVDLPQFAADVYNFFKPDSFNMLVPDDENFADAWSKRQPTIANNFEFYKSLVEKVLPGLTFASGINDDLKKKYIEIYGQKDYDDFYTLKAEGKKRIELPFITEEMGQDLLDLGFRELPFYAKPAIMILENMGIGGALSKGALDKGTEQLKRVRSAKSLQPERYGSLTNLQALRKLRVDESRNAFTKYLRTVQQNLGNKYKKFGAIDAPEVNENRANAINLLDKQIDAKELDILKAKNKKIVDSREIASLNRDLENLINQKAQYTFPFPRRTFMTEVFKDETVVGLGQAGGYFVADAFGMDTGIGEIFGAISTAVKVPQVIYRNTVGIALRGLDKAGGGIVQSFATTVDGLPFIPKGMFVDYRFDRLSDHLGRPLNGKELASVKEISRIIKGLKPEYREMVWNSIDEYQRLRGRIIDFFEDPDERQLAKELFSVGFARMSGLAPLIALERNAIIKLKANGKNLEEAVDYQLQSENTLAAADLAIKKLKELMLKSKGINLDDRENLTSIIEKFESTADSFKMKIAEDKIEYLGLLTEFKKRMLADPEVEFYDEDMIAKLSDLEIKLTEGGVQKIVDKRTIYQNTAKEVSQAIVKRGKILEELSGDASAVKKLGPLIEDAYLARSNNIYHQGRLLYDENGLGNRTYDVSKLVKTLIQTESGTKDKATFKAYFSPESEMMRGFSGRNIKKSLDAMAKRAIVDDMGLNEVEYAKLFKYHTSPTTLKVAPEDYLGPPDSVTDMMVVLHAADKQGAGGATLNPFKATMFEIDELKRHFFKIGRRLEKVKPELAGIYRKFGRDAENILKMQGGQDYSKLANIRREYKILNFDPKRKDTLGDFIDNSQTGEPAYDDVKLFEGNTKFPYKTGRHPSQWHKKLGESVTKFLKGDQDALSDIEDNMQEIIRYWSAGQQRDGRMIFDISTEQGVDNLATLQTVISASMYLNWKTLRQATLKKLKQTVELGGDVDDLIKEYNFLDAENYNKLQNLITVKVKNTEGEIETMKLVDLTKMLSNEQDISTLLNKSKVAQTRLKEIETELNDMNSPLMQKASAKVDRQNRAVQKIEEVAGTKEPDQFYKTFVLNGSVNSVRSLKRLYVQGRKLENPELKDADIEKEFNEAFLYQIQNGLLLRAGMAPTKEITLQGLGNKDVPLTVMTNAAQLASDLTDPNTRAILKEIGMDEDQITFMSDIGRFFEYAQGSSFVRYEIGGIVRNISPNEIISRTFNIARRMVSPLYVGTELAARLAIMKGNELIALGLTNKEAGRIIGEMLSNPANLTSDDIKTFGVLLKEFIATELAREGGKVPTYIPEEELRAAEMPVTVKDVRGRIVDDSIPRFIKVLSQPRKLQPLEELYIDEEKEKKANENVQ